MRLTVERLYRAGYPLVWLRTSELHRAKQEIARLLMKLPEEVRPTVFSWNVVEGFERFNEEGTVSLEEGKNNIFAVFSKLEEKTVILVFGFEEFVKRPDVEQALLNFVEKSIPFAMIVFISPAFPVTTRLERYITVIDFALPTREELERELLAFAEVNGAKIEDVEKCLNAGKGLTLFEFVNAIALSATVTKEESGERIIKPEIILKMKEQLVERNANLQVFHPEDLDEIKGLEVARNFIRKAIETKMGKGVLLVGVPGTGKSLLAKTVGKEMGLPTIILEFGNMFGSLVGESEQRLRDALKVVEAMSPCILMIDEIEKGLGGVESSYRSDGGTGARLFGMFLKWLNDRKEGEVYVIATANNIEILPAEFTRSGRWDAMFFVDVPNRQELEELFEYYCKKFGVEKPADIGQFEGYTGAEVKQLCKTAKMLGRRVEEVKAFVRPIVETQKEKIEKIRKWAESRCVPASKNTVAKKANVRRVG